MIYVALTNLEHELHLHLW